MVWPEPRPQDVLDVAAARFRPLAGEPSPFGEHPRGDAYNAELSLDRFGSERELADRVLERLAPWFEIRREVTGRHCSGRSLRIDAMLRPRDAGSWRDPDVAFGVEFKLPGGDSGVGPYTGWVAQAVSYTHTDWVGYGRRLVLVCPGAASWLDSASGRDPDRGEVMIAKRLCGQLGVGELVLRWATGLTILVNNGLVWSERRGLGVGRNWRLAVPSGHR
ncbi:hypothetical protein [Micromonospora humida]|uniref:Restriction endonuclease n=1 Tax=Micromonospora humida TaxID=2809018 RepID=A0ABS2J007_9ACTN|nr:hypothetical protein [Micromonospora humida]MBM7079114.1 hypothetical protein [Micromonospora humida]